MSKQWECKSGHAPAVMVPNPYVARRDCPVCGVCVSEVMLGSVADETMFGDMFGIWPVAQPAPKSLCCNAEIAVGALTGSWTCLKCFVEYPLATQGANLGDMKPSKDVDPREEELYKRWMGRAAEFRGESRCQYDEYAPLLAKAPKEPWFGSDNPRTVQSMRAVKRWLSTNMREFPVCRHHGESAQLVFVARPHVGGDGEYCLPRFDCKCWAKTA